MPNATGKRRIVTLIATKQRPGVVILMLACGTRAIRAGEVNFRGEVGVNGVNEKDSAAKRNVVVGPAQSVPGYKLRDAKFTNILRKIIGP